MTSNSVFADAANTFVDIENAPTLEAAAPHCDAIWRQSKALGAPFKLFVPFLTQRNFSPIILDRIISHLRELGNKDAAGSSAAGGPNNSNSSHPPADHAAVLKSTTSGPAHLTMYSIGCCLITAAHSRVITDNNDDIFNAAICIARAPAALRAMIECGIFLCPSYDKVTAMDLINQSLLGALIGLNLFKHNTPYQVKLMKRIEMFPFENGDFVERKQSESEMEIQHNIKLHTQRCKELIEACLRSSAEAREHTFRWIAKCLMLNKDYKKSRQEEDQLFDLVSLFSLMLAMVQLAIPILGQKDFFPSQLSANYLYDSGAHGIVSFGDEETVISGESAPAKPDYASSDAYHPKYHIFFLAVRCMDVVLHSICDHLRTYSSQLSHVAHRGGGRGSRRNRDAEFLASYVGFYSAMLSMPDGAAALVRFTDGVAEWLVAVTGVSRQGEIDTATGAWGNLPLTLIDSVFEAINNLCVKHGGYHDVPLPRTGFFEISHVVSLCLILMGNVKLLPKAYTHLNYPGFLMYLLHEHEQQLRNHPWFVTHSLRACIECYIIVEEQEYDRVNQRHLLNIQMERLLQDRQVVDAVRQQYNVDKERRLERLTKMMSSDAVFCLDLCIDNLSKMHKAEQENNGVVPQSHENYAEWMDLVKNGVALSKSVLTCFTKLLDQFKQGMAQHLVVQQVGAMLVSFLVKMVGPKSSELKSLSMELCNFRPRELLVLIVDVFVRFHDVPDFYKYCVEGSDKIADFFEGVGRIKRLNLVPSHLMVALADMEKKMREADASAKEDNTIYTDLPDFAECKIFYDLLVDPVILPGGGADDIVCNREAIRHQLLDNPENPFNRQPLTYDQLKDYNETPEVKARLDSIKQKIEEWKAKKRQEAEEKKKGAAAATAADTPVSQN